MLYYPAVISLFLWSLLAQASPDSFKESPVDLPQTLPASTRLSPIQQPQALFIFVSLSMGEAALKALYEEAQAHGAILVLRGLADDNSFKKTVQTLQRLEISVQINPKLFERYQVQRVPTFVSLNAHEVHTLVGHVSLGYALSRFKEHS